MNTIAEGEDALLAELGINLEDDITVLRHVRSSAARRAAEEIAEHKPCADFDKFRNLFEAVERGLKIGTHKTIRFARGVSITEVSLGDYFILFGQIVFVAEINNGRLRVVYSNGTESNLLQQSLVRALYKDKMSRRIIVGGKNEL